MVMDGGDGWRWMVVMVVVMDGGDGGSDGWG